MAGSVRFAGVSAPQALGPRLAFRFDCAFQDVNESGTGPAIKAYRLTDLSGEVRLAENGPVLGSLVWLRRRGEVRSFDYPDTHQVELICELDAYRLERLEEQRGGQALALWIELWPTFVHDGQPLHVDLRGIRASITRDEWIPILNQIRPIWHELVELRADFAHGQRYRTSLDLLARARGQVDAGAYDEAVGTSRKAIEQLGFKGKGSTAGQIKAALEPHLDEKRAREYSRIISPLKEITNIPHHRTPSEIFSRQEALFVIRAIENVVCLLGATLGTRGSSQEAE